MARHKNAVTLAESNRCCSVVKRFNLYDGNLPRNANISGLITGKVNSIHKLSLNGTTIHQGAGYCL